jgi:hypothetical protein
MRNGTAAPAAEAPRPSEKQERGRSPARKDNNKKNKDKAKPAEAAAIALEIHDDVILKHGGSDHDTWSFCGAAMPAKNKQRKVHFGVGQKPFWDIQTFHATTLRKYDYASDVPLSQKTMRPVELPVPVCITDGALQSAQQRAYRLSKEVGSLAMQAQPAAVSKNAGGPKVIVDSGSGSHLAKRVPNMPGIKKGNPITLSTANGLISVDERIDISFGLLDENGEPLSIEALLLDNTPNVLSLGRLVEDEGYDFIWRRKTAPRLIAPSGKVFLLDVHRYVPFIPEHCLPAIMNASVFREAPRSATRS